MAVARRERTKRRHDPIAQLGFLHPTVVRPASRQSNSRREGLSEVSHPVRADNTYYVNTTLGFNPCPRARGATIAFEECFHEAEPSALHAVASRPEICRETVLAHYLNGFSYERVADCLGVPLTTVNFRLHRAHLEVRRHLSSDGAGSSPPRSTHQARVPTVRSG